LINSIPFNKPHITGKETDYIAEVIRSGKISGDGLYTEKCNLFFEKKYEIKKTLLTPSCTAALEMAAILLNIKEGDEVIVPAYTFVSTVNAFVLRGAKIIFADSNLLNPNIDTDTIESLITAKTKAIVPVHYAGIACDMDKLMALAVKHNIDIVEDAAQAIDSYYKNRALGSIGQLGAFSFHDTKNIISGEGGLLSINDNRFIDRAEIVREKGTNRASFSRGEVDKYEWIDIGSSFLPSEVTAAFLYAQLENLDMIQLKRKKLWDAYHANLESLHKDRMLERPYIPDFATNNGYMYYILLKSPEERTKLIHHLRNKNINSVFHFLSLHKSPYFKEKYQGAELKNSDRYTDCLLRLPMYYDLSVNEIEFICNEINIFFSTGTR